MKRQSTRAGIHRSIARYSLAMLALCAIGPSTAWSQSAAATWIWHPGDFEVWLRREVELRRKEKDVVMPPYWRMESPFAVVTFIRAYDLVASEEVSLHVDGEFNVSIDGRYQYDVHDRLTLPAGKHTLSLRVVNRTGVPSVFVQGRTIVSDDSWEVTSGDAPAAFIQGGVNARSAVPVGSGTFTDPATPPSRFRLAREESKPRAVERIGRGLLADFGRETFGFVRLQGVRGTGTATLYFGESREEALAKERAETFDRVRLSGQTGGEYVHPDSKALRYVYVVPDSGISLESVSLDYEYLPLQPRGAFTSSDERLNRIWEISRNTLHLNTREFFLDGIKRDRWVWSGDAYQSYLMNYYTFFDLPTTQRTTVALRGKEPTTRHLNGILDYTFYWFNGIYDYYLYTGDVAFLKRIYPQMVSLMDFALQRRNADGMVEGRPEDWVFVDWAPMEKRGELSFEQVLFARSLEAMALSAKSIGKDEDARRYETLSRELRAKLFDVFWDESQHALVQARTNGVLNRGVNRYANMFALMYGYLTPERAEAVRQHVLRNERVQAITTPYMRFYELAALAQAGEQAHVLSEMRAYWGGMLDRGATCFWEEYDPKVTGVAQYAMYDRPFGKSLCHAWGASPLYLLGRYFLGVRPTAAGYAEYEVAPQLGGLRWMEGTVPTPRGDVRVRIDSSTIRVTGSAGAGVLRFKSRKRPAATVGEPIRVTGEEYTLAIPAGREVVVRISQ